MEKKKRKINVVDVAIILILTLLIAAFAFFAIPGTKIAWDNSEPTLEKTMIRYKVSIEGFAEEYKDLIKVGEEIRNAEFDCEVGKVVAVEPAENTIVYNYSKTEQKMVPAEVPDSYKCMITVETECEESDKAYYVGAIQVKTGKKMPFKTPGYAFTGVIMDIERSEG